LSVDMWSGSKRSDITALIKDLPVYSNSDAIGSLTEAVLLSESNVEELANYKDVKPGEDLLTLRVYKLIEAGRYKDALELYTVALDTPHHEAIAKAGILSMLGSGEKSIACLEIKTLGSITSEDDFWADLTAYCDYTLSEEPPEDAQKVLEDTRYEILRSLAFNPNFIYPYSNASWRKLSVFEQSLLIAEGRIDPPVVDAAMLAATAPRDLTALLSLKTLTEADRLTLLLKAREWGMVDNEDLVSAYKQAEPQSDALGGLPVLYQALANEEDDQKRNDIMLKAIDIRDEFGIYALIPFAQNIAESSLTGLSDAQMRTAIEAFYYARVTNADQIIENYTANAAENLNNIAFLENMRLIPLVLQMPESHEFIINMQNINIFHKNSQGLAEFNIELLDNSVDDVDNASKVYEKDVDVAAQQRQEDLLKQLGNASRDNALGETVLLSIKLLSGKTIHQADEDVYSDVIKALKKAELNEFSREMAIERLFEK